MVSKLNRGEVRHKRHYRMRNHIAGTAAKPRLCVFRSNKHMYAQVIDDVTGATICAASTMESEIAESLEKTSDVAAAKAVGLAVGKKALNAGIETVVFDRGGYIYHGKVAAVADGAREAGLNF